MERMMVGWPEKYQEPASIAAEREQVREAAAQEAARIHKMLTRDEADESEQEEVRSVSSTGGEKGVKLARFDLLPTGALTELAKHYGRGAQKYDDNNWRRGYEWSKNYAAAQRHMNAFWGGEDIDPETGTPHVISAAWHMFALYEFMHDFPEYDDRFKR